MTYWDEFSFRLGSQDVSCWLTHPRMVMKTMIEKKAYKDMETFVEDWTNQEGTQNYTKVGNSRKKKTTITIDMSTVDYTDYEKEFRRRKIEIANSLQDIVCPRIQIRQYNWGRGVDLHYPVEIRNQDDAVAFALSVKEHLQGSLDLLKDLQDYSYSARDFLIEHPNYG